MTTTKTAAKWNGKIHWRDVNRIEFEMVGGDGAITYVSRTRTSPFWEIHPNTIDSDRVLGAAPVYLGTKKFNLYVHCGPYDGQALRLLSRDAETGESCWLYLAFV